MRRDGSTLPLPPGPPPLPIIGNILDIPKHDMHETFRDMCTKYGASIVNTCPTSRGFRAQMYLPAFLTPFQAMSYTSTYADSQ